MMHLTSAQITAAAKAASTPLYAYSAPALRARVAQLKSAVTGADFVYSLKANPNLSIVRTLTQEGIGAEVCSLFELETAIAAEVSPSKIIFVGPAKSVVDIRTAVSYGVKAIIAESLEELERIDTICAELGRTQTVALRVNPAFHTKGAKLSMSGKPTQFGIDPEDVAAAVAIIKGAACLRLGGLHVYMGTRILDYRVVLENTANILTLAREMMADYDIAFDFIDIGGGFGVPYAATEGTLDLDALGVGLDELIAAFKADHPAIQIIIELGRYMVAEAGSLVVAVHYVKNSKGQHFAVCDGGSNVHGAAGQAASFRKNFPINAVAPRAGEVAKWNISGPLCTPTDIIGNGVELAPLQPGDLIQIDRSGAYGLTASPANFLSFATPAEVLVDGDDLTLIRARGTLDQQMIPQAPKPLTENATRETRNDRV